MPKLTQHEARAILGACNATGADFHALSSDQVRALIAHADARRYREPRNASGSRARYWHAYLERAASGPRYVTVYYVQGHYGEGWEDLCGSIDRKEARADLRDYRENAPGAYRLITRREVRQ